jgi:TM2 domain-containing membrane protein YozV
VTYNIYHAPPPAGIFGAATPPYQPPYPYPNQPPVANPYGQYAPTQSRKSRLVALLLLLFFGGLGIHRFYVGKIGTGIFMILLALCGVVTGIFLLIVGIWLFIDFIAILVGSFMDSDGLPLVRG